MTNNYFSIVEKTYIENWDPSLYKLSCPQTDLPLTQEEAYSIGFANKKYCHWFSGGKIELIDSLEERIDNALNNYPNGAFIRLGSRSGKDSRYAINYGLKITNGQSGIRMLTEDTFRIAYDLRLAILSDYLPHIFIRQWYDIPTWSEFRCFMKNRQLVGISQYDCINQGHVDEIGDYASHIESSIKEFFEIFKSCCHLHDVIFDVFIATIKSNSKSPFLIKLLELNPYLSITDPCLFTWQNGGDFDGSFRYL